MMSTGCQTTLAAAYCRFDLKRDMPSSLPSDQSSYDADDHIFTEAPKISGEVFTLSVHQPFSVSFVFERITKSDCQRRDSHSLSLVFPQLPTDSSV
jgi:hypothetical protein